MTRSRSLTLVEWDAIPAVMATKPQWLLWKFEGDPKHPEKKPRKVPYYIGGGKREGKQGDERDRKRLATLEAVRKHYAAGGWDGVGFAFLPGDGLIGVDIDDAIDAETGEIADQALRIIEACASFTEYSPSGKGVHIYLAGVTERHKVNAREGRIGLEIFAGAQFFTVTGKRWPGSVEQVAPATVQLLKRLHRTVDELRDAGQPPPALPAPGPDVPRSELDDRLRDMRDALQAVSAAGLDYDQWVAVGGILRAEFGDAEGFALWDRWSAQDADRYPGTVELTRKWKSFGKMRGGNLIFRLALAADWKSPRHHERPKLRAIEGGKGKASRTEKSSTPAPAAGRDGGAGKPPNPKGKSSDGSRKGPPPGGERLRMPFCTDKGVPKGIRENVYYALLHDPDLKELVVFDEFSELHMKTRPAPWDEAGRHPKPFEIPIEWQEIDTLRLCNYMAAKHRVIVGNPITVDQAVDMASRDCRVHPIREYLEAVVWDGRDRLPFWISDFTGTPQREYAAMVGTRFFLQLVARALDPGCKADYALIFQGGQGRMKSTAFRVLGGQWFAETPFKIGDKDSYMQLQGVWLYEMSELDSLSRSESTAAKAFISAREDRYRAPYGQRVRSVARRTVLCGTTNPEQFLKDTTGDRRYWPVRVEHEIDLVALAAVRDQLFAEALHRYRAGERYWNTLEEEEKIFESEREPFAIVDVWADQLQAYVDSKIVRNEDEFGEAIDWQDQRANCDRDFFSTVELMTKGLHIEIGRVDRGKQMQGALASCMRVLGFVPHRETGGKRRRGYLRKRPVDTPGGTAVGASGPAQPDSGGAPAAAGASFGSGSTPVAGSQSDPPRPAVEPGPAPGSALSPAERARQAVEAADVPL